MKDFVLAIRDSNGRRATCRCRVEKIGNYCQDGAVVLFTEVPSNEGMSITNASETFATAVIQKLNLSPIRSIFIEHYDRLALYDESYVQRNDVLGSHTFSLITYDWEKGVASTPSWTHVTKEWVEVLFKTDLLFLEPGKLN